MFDSFTPFQLIKLPDFSFNPSRFEIWSSGKLHLQGNTKCKISMLMKDPNVSDISKISVVINDNNFSDEILSNFSFDISYTGKDRILLATVSNSSNIDNYNSYMGLKSFIPNGFPLITRDSKDFILNEPFVCSLFLINQKLSKLTFSIGINPKLIEFYE
jgi:hypothetical protein